MNKQSNIEKIQNQQSCHHDGEVLFDERLLHSGIMGAVCGDIIGLPYELRADRTKDYQFEMKLQDFSDDTILTIAIAEWLAGERSPERLKYSLLKYAIRFLHKNVWGRGFKSWVDSGGTLDCSGVTSNGAAMRVAAIGYAAETEEEVLRLADMSARITHNSDEASHGAQAVSLAVFMARNGYDKPTMLRTIENRFGYDLHRTVEDIRDDYSFQLDCDKCVPESIICYLQSHTYEQAVRNAVSLGGDADTMAAIAGAIAAATPGMEIPRSIALPCFALLPDDFKEILINQLIN